MTDKIEAIKEVLDRKFHAGSRVTNCVVHSNRAFDARPDNCHLCQSDVKNHMNFAIRVNEFLNEQIKAAVAAP